MWDKTVLNLGGRSREHSACILCLADPVGRILEEGKSHLAISARLTRGSEPKRLATGWRPSARANNRERKYLGGKE